MMARKKKQTDVELGTGVGLMMSVSLFLILLTFFILLNSIAVIDEKRAHLAIGSILGAFGSFSGGLSALKEGDLVLPPSAPIIDEALSIERFLSVVDKKILEKVEIKKCKDKEIITINGTVLFDRNISMLKQSSYPLLNQLASLIKKGGYLVTIVGHTDNVPATEKGYKSNWELSTLMSCKVLRYFVEKQNTPSEKLTAYGCGSHKPIKPNDTPQTRLRNVRIDIIVSCKVPKYVKRIFRKRPTGIISYKNFAFRVL